MTTPPTADSPTPKRHRETARADRAATGLLRKLTPREAQTLAHLATGHDLPHTAAVLGVTPTTARSYLLRAMRKLGATTQAEAITLAAGSLPSVVPPGPANFAGLTASSLGPATFTVRDLGDPGLRTGSTDGPARTALASTDGRGGGGDDRTASPAPAGQPTPPPPHDAAADAARHPATDQPAGGTTGPAAPPNDSPRPASGARRGRTARRARQERGEAAHTPPSKRPSARPEQPPQQDRTGTAQRPGEHGEHGETVRAPSPAAASVPAAAAADAGRPQRPGADRPQQARPPREERHDTARTDPAPSAAGGPGRAGPANAADPGTAPTDPRASSTATRQQTPPADPERSHPAPAPAADGPDRNDPTSPARRDGAVRDAGAATVPKGPQRPPGGPAQPGTPGQPPTADPVTAGPAQAGAEALLRAVGGPARPTEQRRDPSPAAAAPPPSTDHLVPSFEELYETAHTRLVQQMFLLTACRHRAVHCVRRAFGEARRGWPAVAGSGDPEGWVRVRACELALSPWHRGGPRRAHVWGLPHRRIKVRPADESQAVLPDHDRLTDRDRALLKALKRLSRPQRRALVLHDGLGLPAAAIAVEVESTQAAAEGRVWTARAALAQWVPDLVGPDPATPGFADGLSLLLHRAAVRGCPEPHRSPVPVLRARHRLWTASRTGAAALLTVAVGGATLATLAGVRPAVLFRPPEAPEPALCLPAAEAEDPGVPLQPGGVPNGISSLWCSPAPGLEAVVVEPHPQAIARWELPAAARGADAPPPQGPAVCPLWSPRPCTTGPKTR